MAIDASSDSEHSSQTNVRPPGRRVLSLAVLPSIVTVGNGIAGFAAIVMLAKAYAYLQVGADHPEQIAEASRAMLDAALYIGLAGLLDMLDGRIARMAGVEGAFGAELDSLCDAISFGVAPAFFLRVLGEAHFGAGLDGQSNIAMRLTWLAAAMYVACTVLRLARYNVETAENDDHRVFRGLPSPAAAASVVGLFLVSWYFRSHETGGVGLTDVMTVAVPLLGASAALLMVSRVRYVHFFNKFTTGRRSFFYVVLLLALLGGIWVAVDDREVWPLFIAGAIAFYVLSGPAITLYMLVRDRLRRGRRVAASRRRAALNQSSRQ